MRPTITTYEPPPPAPDWFGMSFQVLADGALARFQADHDILGAFLRRRDAALQGLPPKEPPLWPRPWPPFPAEVRARIQVFDGRSEASAVELALEALFPTFDRLPDGRWIVADARCEPRQANASVVELDGSIAGRFPMGDGIAQVLADAEGRIWVGYFDEGIFGAHAAETAPPLGGSGLNAFDSAGRIVWSHDAYAEGAGQRPIYDCDALNVFGDEVWCCPDSPRNGEHTSPLLRLRRGREQVWDSPLSVVDAIAVHDGSVAAMSHALHGPYELTVLQLGSGQAEVRGKWPLSEFGLDIGRPDAVLGRGSRLHVIEAGIWHVLEFNPDDA